LPRQNKNFLDVFAEAAAALVRRSGRIAARAIVPDIAFREIFLDTI